ncbi:MAG: molybdate ABC transporter substrate-binding protein [Coriobacteriia bacterium]
MITRRKLLSLVLATALASALSLGVFGCTKQAEETQTPPKEETKPTVTLNIQAAASLKDSLNEITAQYTKDNPNVKFTINYDASGTLQTQIEQGAPADIFLSAAKKNMDALETGGLLLDGTRTDLLGNSLVVVVPKDSTLGISAIGDLAKADVKTIALGDPASVPAGKYGRQALTAAGVYDAVSAKAVLGKDVKAVLTYVESGDADAGIVYKTDALTSDSVKVASEISASMHDAIVYPGAVIKASTNQDEAKAFLTYLSGDAAMKVFESYGFTAPSK